MVITEDPGGTATVTTEGEETVAEITATEATGTESIAQETETPEAGGTPGERLEIGRTEGGTTAAMAGAPTTAIRTPEAVAKAAENQEDG